MEEAHAEVGDHAELGRLLWLGYGRDGPGRAEAMIDPVISFWDVAALIPVVREIGGFFTDSSGGNDYPAKGALATNGKIADEIRELLKGER